MPGFNSQGIVRPLFLPSSWQHCFWDTWQHHADTHFGCWKVSFTLEIPEPTDVPHMGRKVERTLRTLTCSHIFSCAPIRWEIQVCNLSDKQHCISCPFCPQFFRFLCHRVLLLIMQMNWSTLFPPWTMQWSKLVHSLPTNHFYILSDPSKSTKEIQRMWTAVKFDPHTLKDPKV